MRPNRRKSTAVKYDKGNIRLYTVLITRVIQMHTASSNGAVSFIIRDLELIC